MRNLQDAKRELVETLSPEQKRHLDSVRWLYNQQRGAGKTYLLCVETLLQVCEGRMGFLIDHSPYQYNNSYLKNMLLGVASHFDIRVRVKEIRPGVLEVRYDPAPELAEYSNPNLM